MLGTKGTCSLEGGVSLSLLLLLLLLLLLDERWVVSFSSLGGGVRALLLPSLGLRELLLYVRAASPEKRGEASVRRRGRNICGGVVGAMVVQAAGVLV